MNIVSSDINIHIDLSGGGTSGVSVESASAQTAPQPMALQQLGASALQTAPGPGAMKNGDTPAASAASCCGGAALGPGQAPMPIERLAGPGINEAPSPGRFTSSDEA
jgi:hypothetical protein